jgi:regulator of replication initiation timing
LSKENRNYKLELENMKQQYKLLKTENAKLKEEVTELRRKISTYSAISSGDHSTMVFYNHLFITF